MHTFIANMVIKEVDIHITSEVLDLENVHEHFASYEPSLPFSFSTT